MTSERENIQLLMELLDMRRIKLVVEILPGCFIFRQKFDWNCASFRNKMGEGKRIYAGSKFSLQGTVDF